MWIETLVACGVSHRAISRRTGVGRKTIRRYAAPPKSPGVATGSGPANDAALRTPPPVA